MVPLRFLFEFIRLYEPQRAIWQAAVVRLQGAEHAADHLVGVGPGLQGVVYALAGLQRNRDYYVSEAFAFGVPHHAADGLHHVHVAVAGVQKRHRVQRRHVHPFCEQPHVAQHAGRVLVGTVKLVQSPVAAQRAGRRVQMLHRVRDEFLADTPGNHVVQLVLFQYLGERL